MPKISISDEMYERLEHFKPVVEVVIDEELEFDVFTESLLAQGIDSMLVDLLGSLDVATLLKSFQQLASKYPSEVYQYILETMKQGAIAQQQESIRKRMGFSIPSIAEDKSSHDKD